MGEFGRQGVAGAPATPTAAVLAVSIPGTTKATSHRRHSVLRE
jgi:hypothetical protein